MASNTDPIPTPAPAPPSPSPEEDKADEYEEVTETRIVGITDTGVIRKRSFKRKVRKEDRSNRGFGHNHEHYDKIRKQVLQSKMATESVSGLSQRFRLIQMMHTDCLDLVASWKKNREERIRREEGNDFQAMVFIAVAAFSVVFFVCRWIFL